MIDMSEQRFVRAMALIDAANSEDPRREISAGKDWPKELLYSRRMSEMLERYVPEADDALKLAARAQHIQRWTKPRNDYPLGRKGYHQWRAALSRFHADTIASLLTRAGYGQEFIERITRMVGKKSLHTHPDSQLLEDVATMVFLEQYLSGFAAAHPEYDEAKWTELLRRVWNKMSSNAQRYVAAGKVKVPVSMVALLERAVSG